MIVKENRFDETFNYRLHWMWVVAGVVSKFAPSQNRTAAVFVFPHLKREPIVDISELNVFIGFNVISSHGGKVAEYFSLAIR